MTTETTNLNGKKKKVLIVDDEPDISTILKKVFEQNGFNADSYDDPILALENFKPGSFLLDIKMPEMDGFHLYQKMKTIDSKLKVCFSAAKCIMRGSERKNVVQ